MTTTEAFDTWWTESPENFCKAPLGSPECEMHRRTWKAATERAAKRVESCPPPRKLEGGRVEIGDMARKAFAAAIRARDEGVS